MGRQWLFKLDQNPEGRGLRCDGDGLFPGRDALLERDASGDFAARPAGELRKLLRHAYGDDANWESCSRRVELVAHALNKGDMARAMMTAVLMRLPDLVDPAGHADAEGALAKAGFNPDEPRDSQGRWTADGDDANDPLRDPRTQLADAGISDASNDAVAQAVSRAKGSLVKPDNNKHEDVWETLVSHVSDDVQAALSQAGRAGLTESEANLAASVDFANTIVSNLRAYANYRAQPWIGSDGTPIQVPVINSGDPLADMAAHMGHDLLEPNTPLVRPATNADWIDALVNAGSGAAILAGPLFEAGTAGATATADTVEIAADAPFLIPPSDLPDGFDVTWPVGRYAIPTEATPGTTIYGNSVHEQIGRLVQEMFPDVRLTLRTAPYETDADIEIPDANAEGVGFRYAEIKPGSKSGFSRFKGQIARWKKPDPVLAITYDYQGNIYYGFPW